MSLSSVVKKSVASAIYSEQKFRPVTMFLIEEVEKSDRSDRHEYHSEIFRCDLKEVESSVQFTLVKIIRNRFRINAACVIGYRKQVYLIGGMQKRLSQKIAKHNLRFAAGRDCFRYDKDQQVLKTLPELNNPRAYHSVAVVDDKMFVVGGQPRIGKATNTTEQYDPDAKIWDLDAELPEKKYGMAAVGFMKRLWVLGGIQKEDDQEDMPASRTVHSLDVHFENTQTKKRSWQAEQNLPVALANMGAVAVGDLIVLVGGRRPFGSSKELKITGEVWFYNGKEKKWHTGPQLKYPRSYVFAFKVGKKIYACGGSYKNDNKCRNVG